jgi:hypothetical protein
MYTGLGVRQFLSNAKAEEEGGKAEALKKHE